MAHIQPIRTEEDYDVALGQLEQLMDANPPSGSIDADHLEVLATLVGDYEDANHHIPPPTPVAALEFFLENGRITRKDLELALGSSGRVTEILAGSRSLSLAMIRRLVARGLPLQALIGAPTPELWLDLAGPGRASAALTLQRAREIFEAASLKLRAAAVAMDTQRTRLVLEGEFEALRRAHALFHDEWGSAIIQTRRLAWPDESTGATSLLPEHSPSL